MAASVADAETPLWQLHGTIAQPDETIKLLNALKESCQLDEETKRLVDQSVHKIRHAAIDHHIVG